MNIKYLLLTGSLLLFASAIVSAETNKGPVANVITSVPIPIGDIIINDGGTNYVDGGEPGGTGNVNGPASSTINNFATFSDLTGKNIKDSGLTIGTSGATIPLLNTANTFGTAAQTFTGKVNITTASNPAASTSGSILNATTSYAYPSSGVDDRPHFVGLTLAVTASTTSGTEESIFAPVFHEWTGPATITGETNVFHSFIENDIVSGCSPVSTCNHTGSQEGFEASGLNNISLNHLYDYLGIFTNSTTGTVSDVTLYQAGFTNNNTTAGAIGKFAVIDWNGITLGSGASSPSTYYFMANRDASANTNLIGPLSLGTMATNPGTRLYIASAGSGGGTDSIIVKNTSAVNIFVLEDNGTLVTSNDIIAGNIRGTPVGNGAQSTGAFTTLSAVGTVNLNVNNNFATNIGTGSTTSLVTIGGANTVALATNTINLTGSTFATAGCTALTVAITTGTLGCTASDKRLKTDGGIVSDDDALADILAMPDLHQYQYKDKYGPGGHFVGYFAQDIQAVHPGWVNKGAPTDLTPDGTLQYDQNYPASRLVGAIKALNRKIESKDPVVQDAELLRKIHIQQIEICILFGWLIIMTVGFGFIVRRK